MNLRTKRIFHAAIGVAYFASMFMSVPTSLANAQAITDPMRPANAPRVAAGPTRTVAPVAVQRLTAVFFNGVRRIAVVDGRVVKEGDRLSDGVVAEITADSVHVQRAAQIHTLKLPKSVMPMRVRITAEIEP
jgi:MSHA biogenesis protein MshK